MEARTIPLGTKCKDKITGFVGFVVGHTRWLSHTDTYGLQASELSEAKPLEPVWFDESRLEIVNGEGSAIGFSCRQTEEK